MVNFALLAPTEKNIEQREVNQPYIFSGPHYMIYPKKAQTQAEFSLASVSRNGNQLHGLFTYNFYNFLGVGYFWARIFSDIDGHPWDIDFYTFGRIAGFDYQMLGIPESTLKDYIRQFVLDLIEANENSLGENSFIR